MADFQFTENEFMRASLALSRRRLVRTIIVLLLAIALIIASFLLRGMSPADVIRIGVVAALVIFILVPLAVWLQLRKAFRGQPVLQALLHVAIDEQQLSYTWERGSYVLPWANVRSWRETADFFFLFESAISARILPKRALSEAEMATIRSKVNGLPKR